jgi:hypothetical protein
MKLYLLMASGKRLQAQLLTNWGASYALAWSLDGVKYLEHVQQVLLHSLDVNAIRVHRLEGSVFLQFTDTDTAQKLIGKSIRVKRQQVRSASSIHTC